MISTFEQAHAAIWERSGWDRGFISNPFAGDDAARLGLERTRLLLAAMGNPHEQYPIVHVAGSKGKGSTSAFVDAIFSAAGVRSGRFLSPHLHSMLERFAVDGRQMSEEAFTALVAATMEATAAVERDHPDIGRLTAWELSTAIALEWFARSQCEAVVLEVGLGGTLDATNVVDPAVSVITRLDFEHTSILGKTMREIAGNKAGIIKPGRPVVTVAQPLEGLAVLRERTRETGSPLYVAGDDWKVEGDTRRFRIDGRWWHHAALATSLKGSHQMENAALAVAAVHVLGRDGILPAAASDPAIREGVLHATLPGRFEVVEHRSGTTYVLDGAHTPEAMAALVAALDAEYPGRPVVAVVAMLAGRDPAPVLAPLAARASRLRVGPSSSPRALPATELARALGNASIPVEHCSSVANAVCATAGEDSVVVVTGSFSAVADARVALGLA